MTAKKTTPADIRAGVSALLKRFSAIRSQQQKMKKKQAAPSPSSKKQIPLFKSLVDTYPCFSCDHYIPDSDHYSGNILVCICCDLSMYDLNTVSPVPLKCADYEPRKKEVKK